MADLPTLPDVLHPSEPFDLDAALDTLDTAAGDLTPHEAIAHAAVAARWRVADLDSAEWAMARWSEAQDQLDQIAAQAAVWKQRIDGWAEAAARRHEATASFMSDQLTRYAIEQREESAGKVKSLALPSGKVTTTARRERIVIEDADALLAWLDTHQPPEVVASVVKRTVATTPLKELLVAVESEDEGWKVVDVDGQAPVGVTVAPPTVGASLKAAR